MMLIKVTQEHIDQGKKGSRFKCPIGLAIKENPDMPYIQVTDAHVEIGYGIAIYVLPVEAQRFIHNFDEGFPVQPFEFELPLED